MQLSKLQRRFAESKRNAYRDTRSELFSRVFEATKKPPGSLTRALGWDAGALMFADRMFALWQDVLDQADNPENTNTPRKLHRHYLAQLRDIEPPNSGGVESRRLEARAEHQAIREFLEQLDGGPLERWRGGFLALGESKLDEATADVQP